MAGKKYLDFIGLTELVNKLKAFFQKKEFTGTHNEWNQLTPAEKAKYEIVNFTDDEDPAYTVVDSVTNGDMHAVTSNAVYDALANVGTVYSVTNNRPSGGWAAPESGKESTSISITCPRGIYLYQVYMEGDGASTLPANGWVYAYGHCNSAQAGGGWQGIRFPVSTLLAENFTEDLYFSAWNPKKVTVMLTLLKQL